MGILTQNYYKFHTSIKKFCPVLKKITSVSDIGEMEDDLRNQLLMMPTDNLLSVAKFCNNFPEIEMTYESSWKDETIVDGNSKCSLVLFLERNPEDDEEEEEDQMEEIEDENTTNPGVVHAPLYPLEKKESWWIFVGENSTNNLLSVKNVQYFKKRSKVTLSFEAPNQQGSHTLAVRLMSDSCLGCDQQIEVSININEVDESDESDSSSMDD